MTQHTCIACRWRGETAHTCPNCGGIDLVAAVTPSAPPAPAPVAAPKPQPSPPPFRNSTSPSGNRRR